MENLISENQNKKYNISNIKLLAQKARSLILDLLFPSFCAGCKKEGSFLCKDCKEKIEILNTPSHIGMDSHIKKLYCATTYKNDILEKLIYDFKFQFISQIKNELSELLLDHLKEVGFKKDDDHILIPVPLHKKRLMWRGFNQSEVLAEVIGKELGIPVINNALIRKINTEPQSKIEKRKIRIKNIKNVFKLKDSKLIENKKIILVDDITTTGSTLKECAKELKKGNPSEITAFIVAK